MTTRIALLACALALLGDDDGATELYQALVLPYLKTSDTWHYVDIGTFEENYAATVYASLLANLIDAQQLDGFILYLLGNESGETLPAFALMSYVTRTALPTSTAAFSCAYNGETETWSLSESPAVILLINLEHLAASKIVQENAADQISITTSCEPESLSVGSTASITSYVTFSEDCPGEIYTLDFVLPSGTRYSSYEYVHNSGCYLVSQEANRLTFVLDRRNYEAGNTALRSDFTVTIEVRAVLTGDFIFEEPIVKGVESSLLALGDRFMLTVK